MDSHIIENTLQSFCRWSHEWTVKWRANRQLDHALCTDRFRKSHSPDYGSPGTGDHGLTAPVIIRRCDHISLFCLVTNRTDRVHLKANDDRHCAVSRGHCRLHQTTPLTYDPQSIAKRERADAHQCA